MVGHVCRDEPTVRPELSGPSWLLLVVAGVLWLLPSFLTTTPAQLPDGAAAGPSLLKWS